MTCRLSVRRAGLVVMALAALGCAGGSGAGDVVAADARDVGETGPDAVPQGWWSRLQPSGLPLAQIAGVASQMSTSAAPNEQRDFEYAQYAPYPGFRMRNGHRFNDVEPSAGDWHFENVSGSVDGAVAGGSRVLMGLDYSVEWAQDGDASGTVHLDDFAEYARRMAERFCATVKEYEVWNEPNLARFWAPKADPARYADLLVATTAAIRSACPDARVAFGGMSSFDDVHPLDTWGFLRRALEARPGLCDSFDVLALHPYTWAQVVSPEHDEWRNATTTLHGQTAMTELARRILADAGCAPKPIWYTELGWPSFQLTEDLVAAWAVRSLMLTARDGVEAWCWYTFWDTEPVTEGLRPHEHYFGLFGWVGEDGTVRRVKPAWRAVSATLDRLAGHRFARDLGPELGLPNDVYALAFVDDAGHVAVAAWDGRDEPDLTADGPTPGGPDTTYDLVLPLPPGTTSVTVTDLYGTPAPAVEVTGELPLRLTPQVQVIALFM